MGRSTELGLSVFSWKTNELFLSVHVDDTKMAGKKAEYGSHVEGIVGGRGSTSPRSRTRPLYFWYLGSNSASWR